MRISPTELQAVQRAGMLTRFAVLGPVAFVMVDLPEAGTPGTGLELECLTEHHGIVVRGAFTVHHADGRVEVFEQGDAFYVPPGPPAHWFTSSEQCVVEGFAVVPSGTDTSVAALDAIGFSEADRSAPPLPPPATVRLRGSVAPFQKAGAIDIEGSQMGDWLFVRAQFGPRGGYTSSMCDLTHWGIVLDGEVAITYADSTELASRGDVYLAVPGHRFTSPDGVTIADYTATASLDVTRIPAWRRAAFRKSLSQGDYEGTRPAPRPASGTGGLVRIKLSPATV